MSYPYQGTPDPTDVVGRRVVATIVDGLVITVPATAITVAEFDFEYLDESDIGVPTGDFCDLFQEQSTTSACFATGDRVYFSDNTPVLGWLTGLVLSLLLLVLLQGLKGLTPGKALLGLRTVREDGQAPGIGKALVRWVLLIVDALPYCLPLVGAICALTTTGHRRIGDMAARTFVVGKAFAGRPVVVPGMPVPPGAYPGPAASSGWGAPGAPGGEAWGAPQAPARTDANQWGTDPASSDSWAAAHPQGMAAGTPAPTPSGERPAPPVGAPPVPSGERPVPPAAAAAPSADDRPAPPAWSPAPGAADAPPADAPATGETQAVPVADAPSGETPAEHAVPFAGATAIGQTPGGATEVDTGAPGAPGDRVTDRGDDTALAAPDAASSRADTPAPDAPGGTDAATEDDAHPLDVAPPAGEPSGERPSPADPDGTVVGGPVPVPAERPAPTQAPAPGAAAGDTDATMIAPAPAPAPAASDPDATVVGEAPADATMVAPTPVTEPAPGAQQQPAAAAPAQYNPQWDAARNTYIVWEPGRGQWLGWDDNAKEWRPL